MCAIACDAIEHATLDWLGDKNQLYFTGNERVKKATLQCGHGFALMQLAYHFSKNNMRCPVCRHGEDTPMNVMSLPAHLREPFRKHIAESRESEARIDAEGENAVCPPPPPHALLGQQLSTLCQNRC